MSDSSLDQLIGEFRGEASAVEEGGFRLDKARALDKIKRFQLPEPHHYVLELVQSAVAARASKIRITMDADDMIMEFDGDPYPENALREIFDYLFTQDPEGTRFRTLALGLNTGLAFDPELFTVHSPGGHILEVRSATDTSVVGAPKRKLNKIHLRERTSWKVIKEALWETNPEEPLLAERCHFSPVPITLNGRELRKAAHDYRSLHDDSQTHALQAPLWVLPFNHERVRGEIVLPLNPLKKTKVSLCTLGVQVTEVEMERDAGKWRWLGKAGLLIRADSPYLSRDASRAEVIRDDGFYYTLEVIQRFAAEALAQWTQLQLGVKAVPGDTRQYLETRSHIGHAALRHYLRLTARLHLKPEVGRIKRWHKALCDFPSLVRAPITAPHFFSLAMVLKYFWATRKVPIATDSYDLDPADITKDCPAAAASEKGWLTEVFGDNFIEVDAPLSTLETRRKNRRKRESLKRAAVLPDAWAPTPFVWADLGVHGALGVMESGGRELEILRKGVPLGEVPLSVTLPIRAIVDGPDFQPTELWDGVEDDDLVNTVRKRLKGEMPNLLHSLYRAAPRPGRTEALRDVGTWAIQERKKSKQGSDLFVSSRDEAKRWMRLVIDELIYEGHAPLKADWMKSWPLFETLDQQPRSLRELIRRDTISYVNALPFGLSAPGEAPLNLDAQGLKLLTKARGGNKGLKNVSAQVVAYRSKLRREQQELAEKRQRELEIAERRRSAVTKAKANRITKKFNPTSCLVHEKLPAELGYGHVGIPVVKNASSWVRFVVDGLPLTDLPLNTPVPLQAVVEAKDVEANETFTDVLRGPKLKKVLKAIAQQGEPLVLKLARSRQSDDLTARPILFDAMARAKKTLPEELRDAKVFETVSHGFVSLRDIETDAKLHGEDGKSAPILYVRSEELQQGTKRLLIRHSTDVMERLEKFTGLILRDYTSSLKRELKELAHYKQNQVPARLTTRMAHNVRFETLDCRGEIGIQLALGNGKKVWGKRGEVQILLDGRPLETKPFEFFGLPWSAVVTSQNFSMGANLRLKTNKAWREAKEAMENAARTWLLEAADTLNNERLDIQIRNVLGTALQRVISMGSRAENFQNREMKLADLDPILGAPLWEMVNLDRVSQLRLDEWVHKEGELLFVNEELSDLPSGQVMLRVVNGTTRQAMRMVFGSKLEPGGETLERYRRARERAKNASPLLPLTGSHFLFQRAFQSERGDARLSGEAALSVPTDDTRHINIQIGVNGKELVQHRIRFPLEGHASVEVAGVQIRDDWADVAKRADRKWIHDAASKAVWQCLDRAIAAGLSLGPNSVPNERQRQLLLDALSRSSELTKRGAKEELKRLRKVRLFPTVDRKYVSAEDLAEEAKKRRKVRAVYGTQVLFGRAKPDGLVLQVSGSEKPVLTQLLGNKLSDYTKEWKLLNRSDDDFVRDTLRVVLKEVAEMALGDIANATVKRVIKSLSKLTLRHMPPRALITYEKGALGVNTNNKLWKETRSVFAGTSQKERAVFPLATAILSEMRSEWPERWESRMFAALARVARSSASSEKKPL